MSAHDAHPDDPPARAPGRSSGCAIRSERLVLRLPTDDDLLALIDLARAGIHPPDKMPFDVPWSVRPSPEFERNFLAHHWLSRAQWTPIDWRLNLLVEFEGTPIGSQSLWGHEFAIHRTVDTGSWLGREFQGRGFGKEMRAAGLAFAFDGLGAAVRLFVRVPRQRGIERGVAVVGLRGERHGRARAVRGRPRRPAIPHDRGGLAVEAATGGVDRRAWTPAGTCSGSEVGGSVAARSPGPATRPCASPARLRRCDRQVESRGRRRPGRGPVWPQ